CWRLRDPPMPRCSVVGSRRGRTLGSPWQLPRRKGHHDRLSKGGLTGARRLLWRPGWTHPGAADGRIGRRCPNQEGECVDLAGPPSTKSGGLAKPPGCEPRTTTLADRSGKRVPGHGQRIPASTIEPPGRGDRPGPGGRRRAGEGRPTAVAGVVG